MSGKKPSNVGFAIVRGFRGQMLYLASVHTGNGFRWVTGKDGAMVIADADAAVALSERASREYGAKTTVVDFSAAEHVIERAQTPGEVAAANCRALLAQLSTDGKVDHKAFIGEMQARSMEHYGKPLAQTQLRLLARIAAAYEAEQA